MQEKKSEKVSIIIIHTNDEQLKEAEKWIDLQDYSGEIEKIFLDNRGNKNYTSAAQALNDGAKKSTGDILIFMHQDIYLWGENSISDCVEYIESRVENIIVGFAGIASHNNQSCFDVKMGDTEEIWAFKTNGVPVDATTLDECFLAMKKEVWEKLKFDEQTCDNWHFYGAEICLHNKLEGGINIILPSKICHYSFGVPSGKNFYRSAKKLAKKYKRDFKYIHTTCIDIKTSGLGVFKYKTVLGIKGFIKGFMKIIGLKKLFKKLNNNRRRKKGLFVFDDAQNKK